MTKFLEEVITKRLNTFQEYLVNNDITQTEAANMLGISKGQLTHILKRERTVNDIIMWRMGEITKDKRPDNRGGIYGIYYDNKIIYVGLTVNFKQRWAAHKSSIKNQIIDDQPFHNSQLDINHFSYKILFDKTNIPLFSTETNKIEYFFITTILPEWNTNLSLISSYKQSLNEKLCRLTESYHQRYENVSNSLKPFLNLGLTNDGNGELIKTLDYSNKEIYLRSIRILQNSKQYKDNPSELNLRFEDINFENKE